MRNRILISAVVIGFFIALISLADAKAEEVWVKVDATGNAIGGAIMCDAGTCGAGSQFSQLTLQAGERYVLQAQGHAGIGNNNPNTQVKVDLATNDWTVTRQVEVKPEVPLVVNDQKIISYTVETVERFNPINNPPSWQPAKPVISTPEIVLPTDTTTISSGSSLTTLETELSLEEQLVMYELSSPEWYEIFMAWLNDFYARWNWYMP